MKKSHATLKNESYISILEVVLAFVAGCLTAALLWYFII